MDDEAVNLTLGLHADIAVNTKRIAALLYIARKEEEIRQRREREAAERKAG